MLDRWPLIGRDQEIGDIKRSIADDAVRGVALAGKPGVGKSRLAREAAQATAAAGWTVRSISATATSRAIPLGAFSLWTGDLRGEPFALARKVVEALTDGTRPDRLVVVVDDAHLLDELSALVVHQLVQSQTASVILTIRSGEPAPAAVTALWKDGMLRRRELEPLSRSAIDELYVYVTSTELLADAWLAAATAGPSEARRLARKAADFAREVWGLQTAVQCDDTAAAERLAELADRLEGPRTAVAARYAAAFSNDDTAGLDAAAAQFEAMGDPLAAAAPAAG